jgi:hypothetical protein
MEFKPRFVALLFPLMFIAAGFVPLITMIPTGIRQGEIIGVVIGISLSIAFFSMGLWLFFKMKVPSIFDKSVGCFWKGKLDPLLVEKDIGPNCCKLDQIHAIQLLRDHCTNHYTYELNLILKDGRRVNAVEHGDIRHLRKDAEILGNFLNVPIWDIAHILL